MKYLVVKPVGGLANRIRVLEASHNYARAYEAKLVILWEKNFSLNAAYTDCFEPIQGARIIDMDYNGTSIAAKLKRKFFDATEAARVSFFTSVKKYDADINPFLNNTEPTVESKAFFDELAQQNKGVFLETCFEFYPNQQQYRLQIQREIKLKAYQLLTSYPSLIGIHIRRTDHAESIARSPIKKFVDEISSQLAIKPDVAFYLSTDSEEVVKQLKDLFAHKIVTGVSVRNRDSKEGITAALTDLCCLSQCKKIIGSFKSSFSERAAIMGHIPLQIVSA